MRFSFNTFNHGRQGQIILEDVTTIMGRQLMALGHEVSFASECGESEWLHLGPSGFIRDGYNFVIESFADDSRTIERIAEAHEVGCRFICIATEEPTDNGFNHGLEPAMIDRQSAFAAASKYFDGILHLIPGDHIREWYSKFAPAAYAELGYYPTWVGIDDARRPTHDFGFYGKMTQRREQRLDTIGAITGNPVLRITSLDVERAERDEIMRGARIILQIRANEEWPMVSNTRCATALLLGRPVCAEPHPYARPWDGIVHFSQTVESFYSDAIEMAKNWRSVFRYQNDQFKALTPEICIGEPLHKIGII